ncbi:MAG: hypothetical protein PHU23_12015 [Dehalococcoidales bacterium]|nr:hypothetical protein [Dehalococcoidales bacterium]
MATENNKNSGVGFGVTIGSLAGTALGAWLARSKAVSAADLIHLDDAAMSALLAIMESCRSVDEKLNLLQQILNALVPGGASENPDSFDTFAMFTNATPANPVRFPAYPVPYDCQVNITAFTTNGGLIYIAKSPEKLSLAGSRKTLVAGQATNLKIRNTEAIYMSGTVGATDGVDCIFEQRS